MTAHDPQDRYRRLVERSGVGLFETSVDGHIEWVNIAAARIVGYDDPEAFMREIHDIRSIYVDPARRDDFLRLMSERGTVDGFEYEIRRHDGGTRWISVSSRARHDAEGAVVGFDGAIVDVTEKKLIEAAAAAMSSDLAPEQAVGRFARVLERIIPFRQLSFLVIEGDHYRRLVSVAGGDTRPLPTNERVPLKGNSVEWLVEKRRQVVVQDTAAGRWPFDMRLADAGVGSYAMFPLISGRKVFATFNIGMSRPHAFTEEIVGLLAAQIGAATQATLNILLYEKEREAVERLEEVNSLKNEFLARVAHDLRTPLAVIGSVTNLLRKQGNDCSPEERDDALDSITRNVERLNRAIRQDLDVALIESNDIVYEIAPFDIGELIARTVADFAAAGASHAMIADVPEDLPLALGDEARNRQVLDNLLSNALKYSVPGRVEVGARRAGHWIEVSVTDEGPGIAPADVPRLFRKMGRLDQSGSGTGLGLYICKSFVEAQGGTIGVSTAAGGGARFSYRLPVAAEKRGP